MPRLFTYKDFSGSSSKVLTYADKHTPVVVCDSCTKANEPFTVKVRIGISVKHPNTQDHHFRYIQLWNLETLIGEVKLHHESFGDQPIQIETSFTFIPKVSLRLKALAYCNQHGLWQSEEVYVKVEQ